MKLKKALLTFALCVIAPLFLHTHAVAADPEQQAQQIQRAASYYKAKQYTQAFAIFKQLAEQGNAKAQYALGLMYYKGEGVKQDYRQAAEWWQKVEAQGFTEIPYLLGVMYEFGQGVQQNRKIAKKYFGKACDNGIQAGCDYYLLLEQLGY